MLPIKGTRKYNKDAFIVIKNRGRNPTVPSQPNPDLNNIMSDSDVFIHLFMGDLETVFTSTLPEEFYKQKGRKTYVWGGATFFVTKKSMIWCGAQSLCPWSKGW